ncbi:MAG: hypothetical protein WCA04_14165, partial [Geobacteraceae bacterium]
ATEDTINREMFQFPYFSASSISIKYKDLAGFQNLPGLAPFAQLQAHNKDGTDAEISASDCQPECYVFIFAPSIVLSKDTSC